FEARGGCAILLNTASSGTLRRQIEAGPSADVYLSANERHMQALVEGGHIRPDAVRLFACNRLVVAQPAGETPLALDSLADLMTESLERIAIGSPRTAPVGEYAEEALRAVGIWDALEPRLILAENAPQIAAYLRRDEVDAAILFATDVMPLSDSARTLLEIDPRLHSPIRYTIAVVSESERPEAAANLVDFLCSPEALPTLRSHGFLGPE
ncbi:molybdate ABC transporter substrate-binding protein, partial [Candidatus Sumerlaeota bacterium]|nr:molybdate ABC transporter substrate-binding protein [Candidatus Sumerlaeota bacterium]